MSGSARDALLEKITKVPGLAKSVRRGLRGVADDLREQGLEHKALKETTKGLVDEIQGVIDEALAQLADNIPEGLSGQITDAVLDGLIGIADGDPAMQVEEDGLDDAAGNATDLPVEADKTLMDDLTAHGMTGKAVKMFDTLIETQAALARDMATVAKVVKSLEGVAGLPAEFKTLSERLGNVERQLRLRPRQATTAPETISDDKELTDAVKDQQAKFDPFFNSHVRG